MKLHEWLLELEGVCDQATPGPWIAHFDQNGGGQVETNEGVYIPVINEDLTLSEVARAAIPKLIAMLPQEDPWLFELTTICNQATPGPWLAVFKMWHSWLIRQSTRERVPVVPDDLTFSAAAREALPKLIAMVRQSCDMNQEV